jgi:hypothetical protein
VLDRAKLALPYVPGELDHLCPGPTPGGDDRVRVRRRPPPPVCAAPRCSTCSCETEAAWCCASTPWTTLCLTSARHFISILYADKTPH